MLNNSKFLLIEIKHKLKQKNISLQQEEFAEELEAFVIRDFFPEIPILRNQLEWLEATRYSKPNSVTQAYRNILRREERIGNSQKKSFQTLPIKKINDFCSIYSGEDELSFIKIIEKQNKKRLFLNISILNNSLSTFNSYKTDGLSPLSYLSWYSKTQPPFSYQIIDEKPLSVDKYLKKINGKTKEINYNAIFRTPNKGINNFRLPSYNNKNINEPIKDLHSIEKTPHLIYGQFIRTPLWLNLPIPSGCTTDVI